VASVFGSISSALSSGAETVVKGASSLVSDGRSMASDLVGGVSSGYHELAGSVVEGGTSLATSVLGESAGKVVGGALSSVSDAVGLAGTTLVGASEGLLDDIGGSIIGSIGDSGSLLGTLAGAAGGILDTQRAKKTWGNLHPSLLARLYACDAQGNMLETGFVSGPITDDSMEMGFNWQSPFEHTGPESKAPALLAMLQTGSFATVINALQVSGLAGSTDSELNAAAEKARQNVKALEGRTGITKLNSRQVFSGMPPIKISMTLHLRAIGDPEGELMELYQRLLSWSLPQQLAEDGTLANIIKSTGDGTTMIEALFPSLAPSMVSMYYGRLALPPMVIESVSHPLSAPRVSSGHWCYLPVQVQLATLTAMDRQDLAYLFV